MAIEYATRYASKVDERFALASMTACAVNHDYDWEGVSTVKVYSVPTVALNDYQLTGDSRYGTPGELDNVTQTMTLSQDKAFTFTIDRRSADDAEGAMQAGRALRREIDEVVIPAVDAWRLRRMIASAGGSATNVTVTAENAYQTFLNGQTALMEARAPRAGRVCFCTPGYYNLIKQDQAFIRAGDLSQRMLVNGSLGMIDGVNVVPVPSSYLPEGAHFLLTHPAATVGPVKLESYKAHIDPPGLSGTLVEGRVRYDAFVLTSKAGAIWYCASQPA